MAEFQRNELFVVQTEDDSGNPQAALVVRQTIIGEEGFTQQTRVIIPDDPTPSRPAIQEAPAHHYVEVSQGGCGECWRCDSGNEWYQLAGKGAGWIVLLILLYVLCGIVAFALWLACLALGRLYYCDD